MQNVKKLTLLLIMMLVVRVDAVLPQASVSTSEIRGQITDPNGGAVGGATITVTEATKGTTRTVKSDENGAYVIISLQPGTYNMKVEAGGFVIHNLTDIHLNVGQTANIPVALGVGGVQAEVNVAAGAEVNNVIGTTPLTDGRPHGIEGLAPTMPFAFTSAAPARQLQFGVRFNF